MFPVELLSTEKGSECLWCLGRNTLKNVGFFLVDGFYFPLISREGDSPCGHCSAPGGKLGLAHLGDISGLTLIVPIRAISVICLINPSSHPSPCSWLSLGMAAKPWSFTRIWGTPRRWDLRVENAFKPILPHLFPWIILEAGRASPWAISRVLVGKLGECLWPFLSESHIHWGEWGIGWAS